MSRTNILDIALLNYFLLPLLLLGNTSILKSEVVTFTLEANRMTRTQGCEIYLVLMISLIDGLFSGPSVC